MPSLRLLRAGWGRGAGRLSRGLFSWRVLIRCLLMSRMQRGAAGRKRGGVGQTGFCWTKGSMQGEANLMCLDEHVPGCPPAGSLWQPPSRWPWWQHAESNAVFLFVISVPHEPWQPPLTSVLSSAAVRINLSLQHVYRNLPCAVYLLISAAGTCCEHAQVLESHFIKLLLYVWLAFNRHFSGGRKNLLRT